MRRFNFPSGFHAGLTVAVLLVLAELAAGAECFRRLQADRRALSAARGAATRSLHEHFAPGAANESAIVADLAAVEAEVEAMHRDHEARMLRPNHVAGRDAVSGYFALGQWVETARAHAANEGILIKGGECFGFRSHLTQPPRSEWRAIVAEQHAAVAQVVEWLIESRPASLESLQREHPETVRVRRQASKGSVAPSAEPAPAAGGDDPGDFFANATTPRAPRLAGEPDRLAFKIVTTGDTAMLRRFVDRLSAADSPFVVRDLAVQKIERAGVGASASPSTAGKPRADLEGSRSRFTLVLDLAHSAPVNAAALSPP